MMNFDVNKTYTSGKRTFNLHLKASFKLHKINVVFGPSGAGKSSLLRLISGLDKVDEGTIKINDLYWLKTDSKTEIPASQRKIAYVFQEDSLFPNMTVLKNLRFAKKEVKNEWLHEVTLNLEINHLLMAKPNELSKGQKQRAALAVALIQEPEFLILDESLSALDDCTRKKIQNYLLELQQKLKFTMIMVSHHLEEVLKMADHVCVINQGHIIKEGFPFILLNENPSNVLHAVVVNIQKNLVTVLIGTQNITIELSKIITPNYKLGDVIEIKM